MDLSGSFSYKISPDKKSWSIAVLAFISNFAYPVIHPNRDKIVKKLQDNDIEVRPMICGSMGTQPFYVKHYGELKLPNVSVIDKYGFYVPNNPKLSSEEILFISNIINEEITKWKIWCL